MREFWYDKYKHGRTVLGFPGTNATSKPSYILEKEKELQRNRRVSVAKPIIL